MKLPLLFVCAALFFTFSSCKKKDEKPTSVTHQVSGSEATIAWQNCAAFTDHDLTICFIGASENRCPCNSNCLVEGYVDATLHITTPNTDTTITLTTNSNPTGLNLHYTETIDGKTIRFVNTTINNPADCETDFANYKKYNVIITVE